MNNGDFISTLIQYINETILKLFYKKSSLKKDLYLNNLNMISPELDHRKSCLRISRV